MSEIIYRQATAEDIVTVTRLAMQLYEGNTYETLYEEFDELLNATDAAIFLAEKNGKAVGFAHCQLRFDYVEGVSSMPVGYLEGVYVKAGLRQRGLGRHLVEMGQAWAKEEDCTEFASDCEIDNEESAAFHEALGFEEAAVLIHYAKEL